MTIVGWLSCALLVFFVVARAICYFGDDEPNTAPAHESGTIEGADAVAPSTDMDVPHATS